MKMWMKAAPLVLLAACGGSHSAKFTSPHALADAISSCSQTYNPENGAIAPGDVATCQFEGHQITLVTGTNAQRDATISMAEQLGSKFGAVSFTAVVGDGWAVMVDSHLAAVDVQKQVGGTIRS